MCGPSETNSLRLASALLKAANLTERGGVIACDLVPVCTGNLNPDVVVVKSAEDRA